MLNLYKYLSIIILMSVIYINFSKKKIKEIIDTRIKEKIEV